MRGLSLGSPAVETKFQGAGLVQAEGLVDQRAGLVYGFDDAERLILTLACGQAGRRIAG